MARTRVSELIWLTLAYNFKISDLPYEEFSRVFYDLKDELGLSNEEVTEIINKETTKILTRLKVKPSNFLFLKKCKRSKVSAVIFTKEDFSDSTISELLIYNAYLNDIIGGFRYHVSRNYKVYESIQHKVKLQLVESLGCGDKKFSEFVEKESESYQKRMQTNRKN